MVNFLTPDGDDGDNVYPAGYISGIVDDTPLGTIGGDNTTRRRLQ